MRYLINLAMYFILALSSTTVFAYGVYGVYGNGLYDNYGAFVPCTNYPYYNCSISGGPPQTIYVPAGPLHHASNPYHYYYNNQIPVAPLYYQESNPYYGQTYQYNNEFYDSYHDVDDHYDY